MTSEQEPPVRFQLDDGIAVLERTPATLRALLAGLCAGWITTDEGPDTFSPFDNVGHLIHGERTDWIPRVQLILAEAIAALRAGARAPGRPSRAWRRHAAAVARDMGRP